MREIAHPDLDECCWRHPAGSAIEITELGLVYTGGSVLVRMRKSENGRPHLATGSDQARLLALLSVAFNRPVAAVEVMPQVETAADFWHRGERALANLRLVFAGLSGRRDSAAGQRVALAACLLDQGWPPAALLEELGLADGPAGLEKYNPNHVPAGQGRRSGQFDFRSGSAPPADGRIVVAGSESDEEYEERAVLGHTDLKGDEEHHRLLPREAPIPFFGGAVVAPKALETLSELARTAAAKVAPRRGPVYGTAVHEELKAQVKASGRDDLHSEQSYLNGLPCDYGTPGSVRVDVAQGAKDCPNFVVDLKTGKAKLTRRRIEQFRVHLPKAPMGQTYPFMRSVHECPRTQAHPHRFGISFSGIYWA